MENPQFQSGNNGFSNLDNALKYVDSILPLLPDFNSFKIGDVIMRSEVSELTKRLMISNLSSFEELLEKKLCYIKVHPSFNLLYTLTPLGRLVKTSGGHFAYLEKLAVEKKENQERQKLNDEKLNYDVKNAKRIFKTYWWTFWISIAGFILALGKIIFDLIKQNH